MEISERNVSDITIIDLSGPLDRLAVPEAQIQISEIIRNGGKRILVNFGKVDWVSSAGTAMFISLFKSANASKTQIGFCEMNKVVHTVFQVSGFEKLLQMYDSRECGDGLLWGEKRQ